jgi:hypothetical protein
MAGRIAQPNLHSNNSLSPATAGFDFSFTSQTKSAAVLVLKPHANVHYTIQHGTIKSYCIKYGRSWYDFAESQGLGLAYGEIIFVYGVVRTATWALAAFSEHDTRIGAGLSLDAGVFAQAGASLHAAWDERSSIEHRSGPSTDSGARPLAGASTNPTEQQDWNFNQTVFLRHYLVKPRFMLAPKVLRASAGDEELDAGDEGTDGAVLASPRALDVQDVEVEAEPQRIPV